MNHTRTFSGVYREVAGSFGITDNTLAPKPDRYAAPWDRCVSGGNGAGRAPARPAFRRVGPGGGGDEATASREGVLFLMRFLGGGPQLEVLLADRWIECLCEIAWQSGDPDQLQDIGQVP